MVISAALFIGIGYHFGLPVQSRLVSLPIGPLKSSIRGAWLHFYPLGKDSL